MSQRKATVDEIRQRFDNDVERFSNLETGQTAAVDSRLAIELITEAAALSTPHATRLLDVGCGAGNFTLAMLDRLPKLASTLLDLSGPMLDRARERVSAASAAQVATLQADIRALDLGVGQFDVIVAAAVLHHLRTEAEWRQVYRNFYRALAPGGSVWVYDLVESPTPALHDQMWRAYGEYLIGLGGEALRDKVFAYVDFEDTPQTLPNQLHWLREAGFTAIEVLHKRTCFAAFGAIKDGK
ncbi:MAG: class I SAM-dependent methyltransferase [Planctomycetes bacterium]|nr:class I SAM-dependent methyltransferase [Planctomycetota bacterium]